MVASSSGVVLPLTARTGVSAAAETPEPVMATRRTSGAPRRDSASLGGDAESAEEENEYDFAGDEVQQRPPRGSKATRRRSANAEDDDDNDDDDDEENDYDFATTLDGDALGPALQQGKKRSLLRARASKGNAATDDGSENDYDLASPSGPFQKEAVAATAATPATPALITAPALSPVSAPVPRRVMSFRGVVAAPSAAKWPAHCHIDAVSPNPALEGFDFGIRLKDLMRGTVHAPDPIPVPAHLGPAAATVSVSLREDQNLGIVVNRNAV